MYLAGKTMQHFPTKHLDSRLFLDGEAKHFFRQQYTKVTHKTHRCRGIMLFVLSITVVPMQQQQCKVFTVQFPLLILHYLSKCPGGKEQ